MKLIFTKTVYKITRFQTIISKNLTFITNQNISTIGSRRVLNQ
jgi:hypothetical protein